MKCGKPAGLSARQKKAMFVLRFMMERAAEALDARSETWRETAMECVDIRKTAMWRDTVRREEEYQRWRAQRLGGK